MSGNSGKDIVLLGMRDEILQIDFTYMDNREIELIMKFVHEVARTELLSRTIESMSEWSSRAQTLFSRYNFSIVSHVMTLTKNQVNQLDGSGYKTRKEIYDVFKFYGLYMASWEPGYYYERMNYKFTDEHENKKPDITTEEVG